MNDPIKVIFKYKNNNKVQYGLYIFTGIVPSKIKTILDNISDLDFYKTLISISKGNQKY